MTNSRATACALALGVAIGFAAGCQRPPDGANCAMGLTGCQGQCLDLSSDELNCGACGTVCSASQACADGVCFAKDCTGFACGAEQVCQREACIDSACVGVICPAPLVCSRGLCQPAGGLCMGVQCSTLEVCLEGMCIDVACVGVRCPEGESCVQGACVSGCVPGSTCGPAAACRIGKLVCEATPRCDAVATAPPGTSCAADKVCDPSGTCVDCVANAACDAGLCFLGQLRCQTGVPSCVASGSSAPGTSCGAGQVCASDAGCVSCASGAPCDAGLCRLGATTCSSGAPQCADLQAAPTGTQCGPANFCDSDGGCLPCANGAVCTPAALPCFNGALSCTDAGATCSVTGVRPPGSVCGANQVCAPDAGCRDCTTGAGCDAGVCQVASTQCGTGTPSCVTSGNLPPGTPISGSAVCAGDGGVVSCTADAGCDAGLCRFGATTCASGAPTCQLSAYAPAGTPAGSGLFCDGDGGAGACSQGAPCSTGNLCENATLECGSGSPVCTPVAGAGRFKSAATVCRAASGACDVAEFCTGSAVACPADGVSVVNTVCQAAPNSCRTDAVCNGVAKTCPAPGNASAGVACGSANAAGCDAPDTCDGSGTCVARVKPAATVCQVAPDSCHTNAVCNGVTTTCPSPGNAGVGTACGSANATGCDAADTCDGSGTCVARVKPAATLCQVAPDSCHTNAVCDGASAACPSPGFAMAGTSCGSASAAGCDAADTCNGSGSCIDRVKPGTSLCQVAPSECRSDAYCDGSTKTCPTPGNAVAGTSCGSSNATGCDAPDTCDGSGTCTNWVRNSSTLCQAAGNSCQNDAYCPGNSATCPSPGNKPIGTACAGGYCYTGACAPFPSTQAYGYVGMFGNCGDIGPDNASPRFLAQNIVTGRPNATFTRTCKHTSCPGAAEFDCTFNCDQTGTNRLDPTGYCSWLDHNGNAGANCDVPGQYSLYVNIDGQLSSSWYFNYHNSLCPSGPGKDCGTAQTYCPSCYPGSCP